MSVRQNVERVVPYTPRAAQQTVLLSTTQRQMDRLISPIELHERRIAELRQEQPVTASGRLARDIAIVELEQFIVQLKVQAMDRLRAVIRRDVHGGEL